MKKNKEQKKGQETTIGKIIYGFLLFMPLIAIGSTLLISTFNMSAKQESEIIYKYETNEVNSNDDLVIGNIYRFTTDDFEQFFYGNTFGMYFLSLEDSNFNEESNVLDEIYFLEINHNYDGYLGYMTDNYLNFYWGDDSYVCYTIEQQGLQFTSIVVLNELGNVGTSFYECFSKLDNQYIPIDRVETHNISAEDVFYNSVDKVTESPLFNWAQNSVIYTTTNATCNALSITAPFIPLLMSYWLIISVIYFLYDIALMLVWLIHKKIHELQETI